MFFFSCEAQGLDMTLQNKNLIYEINGNEFQVFKFSPHHIEVRPLERMSQSLPLDARLLFKMRESSGIDIQHSRNPFSRVSATIGTEMH